MSKMKTRMLCSAAGLSLLLGSSLAMAHVNFDVNIGLYAPPPPPTSVVMVRPPQGYNTCYMTQGMWMGEVWVPAHQECEYVGPQGPQVWVSGYWGCVSVGPDRSCGRWHWYNHRMVRHDIAYMHHDRFDRRPASAPAYARMYHEAPRQPVYAHEQPVYAHAPQAYMRHGNEYRDGRGPY